MKGLILIDPAREGRGGPSWSPRAAALAPVANRPLVAHAADTLLAAGAREVAVVCPPDLGAALRGACAERTAAELRWIEPAGAPEPGRAILEAEAFLAGDRFAVHTTGGLWLGPRRRLHEALRDSQDAALLFVVGVTARSRALQPVGQTVAAQGHGSAPPGVEPGFAIACFGPELVEALHAGDEPTLAGALERLGRDGMDPRTCPADGWSPFSGSVEDLLRLNRLALDGLPETDHGSAFADSRITGRVDVHETARVTRSVLRGPAIIGPGARLTDAYVGPHTVVGDDGVVENAEVEASVLLPGARLQNTGVRIESSVVGQGASVSRTFALPRALRLVLGDDAVVELC